MQPEEVILNLIDQKIISILKTFIKHENEKLSLSQVAKESNVPIATTHRILKRLQKLKIIHLEHIHKYKLFQLNQNLTTQFLKQLIKLTPPGLEEFLKKIKDLEVEEVIQQGIEQPEKINLIILGNPEPNKIKQIVQEIYAKHNYTISYLILTKEQYEQMRAIGLYSGAQKSIYKRSEDKLKEKVVEKEAKPVEANTETKDTKKDYLDIEKFKSQFKF